MFQSLWNIECHVTYSRRLWIWINQNMAAVCYTSYLPRQGHWGSLTHLTIIDVSHHCLSAVTCQYCEQRLFDVLNIIFTNERFILNYIDRVLLKILLFAVVIYQLYLFSFLKASSAGFWSSSNMYPPPIFWLISV